MNDASKYEFFAGHAGKPRWTRISQDQAARRLARQHGLRDHDLQRALKKYLMCVTDGGNTVERFNTYILESDHITGPLKLVTT